MAPPPSVDQQLLFGLLALQNGFVSREQLIAAFGKWTGDKSVPLDDVLVTSGTIGELTRDTLHRLAKLHVSQHGGDVQHSLAVLPGSDLGVACEALGKMGDTDLDRTLVTIPSVGDATSPPQRLGQSTSGGERFRVIRPLPNARGGMGVISIAHDEELGRRVAVKQIVDEHADNDVYRKKFRLEAEVTGNLEHPGVVPVYGLGHGDEGRPFYAMRLVLGDDLKQKIDDFHGNQEETPFSRSTHEIDYASVEFHGLVERLIDVAQAVSYAHSRGVLHRDLKPGNILVGEYGETLVIDWGLARLSPEDDRELSEDKKGQAAMETLDPPGSGSARLQVRSGSDVVATIQGQKLGTVGYAPPEQLNGRVDLISERSDVYALGAILYEILTGQTPIAPPTKENLHQRIQETVDGKIKPPNRIKRSVPKSLNGICLKALSTNLEDRYESAEAFIEELERWKADQPVQAAPDSVLDRVVRLSRRYRSAAVAAAAALLGIALVSAAALILVNRARVRETAAREQAEMLADRNQAVVDSFVDAFRSADPQNEGVTNEMTAREVLEKAVAGLEGDELEEDPLTKATLLNALGMSLNALGDFEGAIPALVLSRQLFDSETGPNSVDTISAMTNLALSYRYGGHVDQGLELSKEVFERSELAYGREHMATLYSINVLANALREAGRFDEALTYYQAQYDVAQAMKVDDHTELITLNDLALAHHNLGQLDKAIPLYEQALPRMREVLGNEHPNTITCMGNLAMAYNWTKRTDQAVAMMEEVVTTETNKIGRTHPNTLINMDNLAGLYKDAGQIEKALAMAKETLGLREEHLGGDHPDTLASVGRLAQVLTAAGRAAEAIPLAERSLKRRRALLGEDHPDTITAMHFLGSAYQESGRIDEAIQLQERVLEMRTEILGADHPETLSAQNALNDALERAIESNQQN